MRFTTRSPPIVKVPAAAAGVAAAPPRQCRGARSTAAPPAAAPMSTPLRVNGPAFMREILQPSTQENHERRGARTVGGIERAREAVDAEEAAEPEIERIPVEEVVDVAHGEFLDREGRSVQGLSG